MRRPILRRQACYRRRRINFYGDFSIFNAARRQVRYIQRNADFDPIPMPRMPIRHRFESIHGDRSAAEELDYFAGIEPKLNSCRNSCVAQYYGVKHVIAVVE
ncbi:MAG: hypothetical protein SR3Q1_04960 [Quinella sp. 3Q1]|nr:hypothetical protein [Quinella sp. 3Q1]